VDGQELAVVKKNRRTTAETKRIEELLKKYYPNHPRGYPPRAYRYNRASIRIRIVDDSFKGKSWSERDDMVDPILRTLPEKTYSDIMILLLLTPSEVRRSGANMEFEHPTPSPV
jgi:stress-induced morphogen